VSDEASVMSVIDCHQYVRELKGVVNRDDPRDRDGDDRRPERKIATTQRHLSTLY